jgi:hypothetical protein
LDLGYVVCDDPDADIPTMIVESLTMGGDVGQQRVGLSPLDKMVDNANDAEALKVLDTLQGVWTEEFGGIIRLDSEKEEGYEHGTIGQNAIVPIVVDTRFDQNRELLQIQCKMRRTEGDCI